MIDKQIILTKDGFKFLSELIPEKDYLVTKSGNFAKFIGFDDAVSNAQYAVKFMTGENIYLSGDVVINVDSHDEYNDVDTIYKDYEMRTYLINNTEYVDFKTKGKVGISHEDCYNIGYKRDFKRLFNVDFTKFSIKQRKEFVAGLIDNGETLVDRTIGIPNIDPGFRTIIVFILRSLGYSVIADNEFISFKPNNKVGLLPIKSQQKAQDVLYMMHSHDIAQNEIDMMSEIRMMNSYQLVVDTDEPILVGYSLIPIYQKR